MIYFHFLDYVHLKNYLYFFYQRKVLSSSPLMMVKKCYSLLRSLQRSRIPLELILLCSWTMWSAVLPQVTGLRIDLNTFETSYCGLQFEQTFYILYKGEYAMSHLGFSGHSVTLDRDEIHIGLISFSRHQQL